MIMNFALIWRISVVIRPTPNIVPSTSAMHQPNRNFLSADIVARQVTMFYSECFHTSYCHHHENVLYNYGIISFY